MEAGIYAFFLAVAAFLLGLLAELHLMFCLREFHPAVHRRAGSPKPSDLLSRHAHNGTWRGYLMLRKFSLDPDSASAFRVAFELAFICTWLRWLAMSFFFITLIWQLIRS